MEDFRDVLEEHFGEKRKIPPKLVAVVRLLTQQKLNTGEKKRKIQGKIRVFLKPEIHGNAMKFSSNTGKKINV